MEKHMIPGAYKGTSFLSENSMSLLVILLTSSYSHMLVDMFFQLSEAVTILFHFIFNKIVNVFCENGTGYRQKGQQLQFLQTRRATNCCQTPTSDIGPPQGVAILMILTLQPQGVTTHAPALTPTNG